MNEYEVFGGRLRSDLVFPWLRPAPAWPAREATWTLARGVVPAPQCAAFELGVDAIGDGSAVTLYRETGRHVIVYDGIGTFELIPGRITWCAAPGVPAELVRLCVIGRVFATVLHLSGAVCLHGSAVAFDGCGVAFLAPPGTGKSTLVRALVEAGARLAADDAIPVEPTDPPAMRGGVAAVRLREASWAASKETLGGDVIATRVEAAGSVHPLLGVATAKRFVVPAAERVFTGVVPLTAVYLLTPAPATAERAVTRTRLAGPAATLALLGNARSGALAAQTWARALLSRCAAVAAGAAVYRLDVARDLSRLPEVIDRLTAWHAPAGALRG